MYKIGKLGRLDQPIKLSRSAEKSKSYDDRPNCEQGIYPETLSGSQQFKGPIK